MDVIIDANCSASALCPQPHAEFAPLMQAILNGSLRIQYGGTKLTEEYMRLGQVWKFLRVLDQAGRVAVVARAAVDEEEKRLAEECQLKSDDPHVLAIARISGARLLCSRDQALHQDFGNPQIINKPRGKIYQCASHAKLLKRK